MKRRNILFLKGSIWLIGFFVLFLSAFFLPTLAHQAATLHPEYAYLQYPVLLGIWVTAIPFFISLYEAFQMLHYIEHQQAFSTESTTSLIRIKHCAGTIYRLIHCRHDCTSYP